MKDLLRSTSMAVLAAMLASPAVALAQDASAVSPAAATPDDIIVTGTRRTDRSVKESAAPIDVFTQADLETQPSADLNAVLRTLVPSFNTARFAGVLSDGSGFVRPPTLRGLPPDEVLVLVNGKRRHRSALVQLNGGSLAGGSQAVDLSQIPTIALERVEVLRDGAAAQYGSDAIAGVMNFTLKRNREGIAMDARYGQYYKGDGKNIQLSGNIGLPLGPDGFLSVSGEYVHSGQTSRGGQRPGAYAMLLSHPELVGKVDDPVQKFGDPKLETYRTFVNGGISLDDNTDLYFFGNYGHSKNEAQFNYRQPYSGLGPDANGEGNSTPYGASSVYNPIYLDQLADGTWDVNGRTFTFHEIYPNGYTPRFRAKITDISGTAGVKGEFDFGLTYDVSASYGQSRVEYRMGESLNLSMGPDSPTAFYMGSLEERETNFNADFSYPLEVGLASPLTIAFGAEHRNEAYEIGIGDPASYTVGIYNVQHLSNGGVATQAASTNGFPGFGPSVAINDSRNSYSAYLDLEADITTALTLGAAARYEHYSDFGSTTNFKGTARYAFSKALALRGTVSTGFRAPTVGQLFTTAGITGFQGASPTEFITLPAYNPAAQLYGAKPLKPEKSFNLSGGVVFDPTDNLSVTLDYYNIRVKDRLGLSASNSITTDAQREALRLAGLTNWATVGSLNYFANGFKTRTQGVDFVASHRLTTDWGRFNTTLAANYNTTKVLSFDPTIVDARKKGNLEKQLPKLRGTLTENWSSGKFALTGRAIYYHHYTVFDFSGSPRRFGAEVTFDLEARYALTENFTLAVGGENILDNYPDKDIRPGNWWVHTQSQANGARYPDQSPFGYNGGFWYVRASARF